MTQLFWIDGPWRGRLAIAARPRGGDWLEDEIRSWKLAGIGAVVSLLTEDEKRELMLEDEQRYCDQQGIQFYSLPIPDRGVPASYADTARALEKFGSELVQGKNFMIHCRQGIGRSALIAASLLIESGLTPAAAVESVEKARRLPVPETAEQRAWIESFRSVLRQEH